ncbi:MAG: hypothetical protein O3A63_18955 [Proteobacteria bacterium]|nr:hypothetical protein [Pseudomonadota bacterium]
MRASPLLLLASCLTVAALASDRQVDVPTRGEPLERIQLMWNQTRPILLADTGVPHSDSDWVALGTPLIKSWTDLEASLGDTDYAADARSVLKFLNDVYGRSKSTPERRAPIRQRTLQNFGSRISALEGRLGS